MALSAVSEGGKLPSAAGARLPLKDCSHSHDGLLAVRHGSASRLSWLCKEFGIAVGAVFQGKQYFFDTQKDKYTKYLWV